MYIYIYKYIYIFISQKIDRYFRGQKYDKNNKKLK